MSKIWKAAPKDEASTYIFRSFKDKIGFISYIFEDFSFYVSNNNYFDWEGNWILVEPTNQEINWLEACEKANKFIPLDQIKTNIEYEIY